MAKVVIIGGGLAGSEAALQLAEQGIKVTLYDMKPHKKSRAHHNNNLAEIVCSNSFGSQGPTTASGLLKLELETLNCQLLAIAHEIAVPAGKALAVDRNEFAQRVNDRVMSHPNIDFKGEEIDSPPEDADFILIATGPMTSSKLANTLSKLVNREQLFFFDAASPILTKESINFDTAFVLDRYGDEKKNTEEANSETEEQSYINCPFNQDQYEALIEFINQAEKTELKSFEKEKAQYFESCLPVEVIASRGIDTLRYGPMKPVGLTDPKTGRWPYAAVQLRQDNREGSLYNIVGFQTNIKWGDQKTMIQMIPGLEDADIVRYGVMHRNTYLHSPEVLLPTLQLKNHPHILVGGQLTGTEGYTESIATGLIAALNIVQLIQNNPPLTLPRASMLGSLLHYITREEAIGKSFQPINSNWGILPELAEGKMPSKRNFKKKRDRKNYRNTLLSIRSLDTLNAFMKTAGITTQESVVIPEPLISTEKEPAPTQS